MKKQVVARPTRKLAFSSGIVAEGKFLFVAGQGPWDIEREGFVCGTVAEQTRLTMECIGRILGKGGATFDDVVSCRVFLHDITQEKFEEMNVAYTTFFPGEDKPVRTTIGCQLLYGIAVEIDCVAQMPESSRA